MELSISSQFFVYCVLTHDSFSMAELVGIGLGLVPILAQLKSGAKNISAIRKSAKRASDVLDDLQADLDFLVCILSNTELMLQPYDDPVLAQCQKSCIKVRDGFENLLQKAETVEDSRARNVAAIVTFRHWEEDLESLRQRSQDAKSNMMLLMNYALLRRCTATQLTGQHSLALATTTTTTTELVTTISAESRNEEQSLDHISRSDTQTPTITQRDIMLYHIRKERRQNACSNMSCACTCHSVRRVSREDWSMEYILPQWTCDTKSCNAISSKLGFRLALSRIGIWRAAIFSFQFLWAPGRFSLRPSFDLERIVPRTSPGFAVLWKVETKQIELEEAKDELRELYRADPTFRNHVNRDGLSYVESLVGEFDSYESEDSHQLLDLLIHEFGMIRGMQSPRLLDMCMYLHIYEVHGDLLNLLLGMGFIPPELDAADWKSSQDFELYALLKVDDPFYIDFLRIICKDDQGYAAMTPLHECIIGGPPESAFQWIPICQKDERNALGQTPMHLAVEAPQCLQALIDAGHDVNALDNNGRPPLLYAAYIGQEEALTRLMEAGADPNICVPGLNYSFMDIARTRGHWTMILQALELLEKLEGRQTSGRWAEKATLDFVYYRASRYAGPVLPQLLEKCSSVNFVHQAPFRYRHYASDTTSMHHVQSAEDAKVLLDHGFKLVNHKDSHGQTPIHRVASARQQSSLLITTLVTAGADIDGKDAKHRAPITLAFRELTDWWAVGLEHSTKTVSALIENGANVLSPDNCKCPCSPRGCFSSAAIPVQVFHRHTKARAPIMSFEMIVLLTEHGRITEAKSMILSFIRRAKFEELGMTHVCCHRCGSSTPDEELPSEDIKEILDEELEFIEILEAEMDDLLQKDYNVLIETWIDLFQPSLRREIAEAEKYNERLTHQDPYEIDQKKDKFIYNHLNEPKHPLDNIQTDIIQYARWAAPECRCENQHGDNINIVDSSLPRNQFWTCQPAETARSIQSESWPKSGCLLRCDFVSRTLALVESLRESKSSAPLESAFE